MVNYTCGVTSSKSSRDQKMNMQYSLVKKNHERFRIRRTNVFLSYLSSFCLFVEIRLQLNDQLKYLEQRIETQLAILAEIQEYFRRRADVELDYAKNLDNLHKQIGQRHRAQKAR